jgi:tetratricopeptide (TPR) repeat protein
MKPSPQAVAPGSTRRRIPRPRAAYAILAAVLMVAAAPRVAYLAELWGTPEFAFHPVDEGFHDYWARGLVTGDWTPPPGCEDPHVGAHPYFRPPGYPYFLAIIYRLAGANPEAAVLAQMGLGLLNCILAYALGCRWAGRAVGLVWAAGIGVYWPFVYYETRLHEPALLNALALLALLALARCPKRATFWAGVLAGIPLGLFALVRPTILPFVPAACFWAWWVGKRSGRPTAAVKTASGMCLAVLGMIAPATIRNYAVSREFVPISSNAGINLYIGNNPKAQGQFVSRLPFAPHVEFRSCFEYRALVRKLEQAAGHPLTDGQASSVLTRKALNYMMQQPRHTVSLVARKALLLACPMEIAHNAVPELDRRASRVLRWLPISVAMVLGGGVLGVILAVVAPRRRGDETTTLPTRSEPLPDDRVPLAGAADYPRPDVTVLLILFAAAYTLSFLPFFVTGVYRQPIALVFVGFASYAVVALARMLREGRWAAFAVWLGAGIALVAAAAHNWTSYAPDQAKWSYDRGVACGLSGDTDRAVAAYRQALTVRPNDPSAHHNLALLLARRGEWPSAIHHYEEALASEPDASDIWNNLGIALHTMGQDDSAATCYRRAIAIDPAYADARVNLAAIMLTRGQLADALEHLTNALEASPQHPQALETMGLAMAMSGRFADAVSYYRRATAANPKSAAAWQGLGNALLTLRRADEAVEAYQRSIELRPAAPAYHNLALALAEAGRLQEAEAASRRAIQLQPDDANAHLTLGNILLAQGKREEAAAQYAEALRLRPDLDAACARLRQLGVSDVPDHPR